jgi:hypothetical protein
MSADVLAVNVGAVIVIAWIVWYFWMSRPGD